MLLFAFILIIKHQSYPSLQINPINLCKTPTLFRRSSFIFPTFVSLLKNTLFILTVVFAAALSACSDDALVDRYHVLPEEGWHYEHIVTDTFRLENPGFYHQIFANLRVSGDYPYANIYLKLNITKPDGSKKSEVISVDLATKSGKWLGSGLGDVVTFQSPILHRKYLDNKGKYTVEIEQNMRLETLANVLAVGLRIEQQEEIY